VLLKKHSESLWRSTEKLGGLSGTWWRARREIWPSWRGLWPQWSRDRVLKGRTRKKRAEIKRRGLRMPPEKVKRRELYCLPPVRLVVLFFLF